MGVSPSPTAAGPTRSNRRQRRSADRETVPESLASRPQVAQYLDIPAATLARWASRGTGPRYVVVGKHTRYRWSDVERWLDEQRSGGGQTA